jgi:FkbM family methyltransferase
MNSDEENDNAEQQQEMVGAGLRNRNANPSSSPQSITSDASTTGSRKTGRSWLSQQPWSGPLVLGTTVLSLYFLCRQGGASSDYSALRTNLIQKQQQSNNSTDKSTSRSTLFPNWLEIIIQQAQRLKEDKVSFQLFDLSKSTNIPNPPPPFFYPIEETIGSAEFIMQNEQHVLRSWMYDLRQAQQATSNSSRKVKCLDIGSNGGFFALMSRSAGCQTLAVDAQPWCLTRLSSAAALNHFDTDFDIQWTAVGQDPKATVEVGATKCGGLWAVKNSGWIDELSSFKVNVSMTPLMTLLEPWLIDEDRIDVMKIDVEGSEFAVLQSALPLFRAKRIRSVFVEIAPQRCIQISKLAEMEETIQEMYKAGYSFRTTQSPQAWVTQDDMVKMMRNVKENVIVDYSIRLLRAEGVT